MAPNQINSQETIALTMEKSIQIASESFDLFMNNRLKEGIAQVSGTSEAETGSVYLNYAKSSMLTFQALIAFNDEDFKNALKACDECLAICNAKVSETWMEQISGTFSDEKYKYWDDEKLHAMLVRAEILFFKTALLACSSGTDLMAIAKICIFSRDSYKLFEKCLDIADIRPWSNENLRKEFLNGAKFGIGMFKLYMSLLPPKILKIMEWIGFSGDGSDAIKKLNECADSKTLRSSIAVMTPWSYYYIFEFQFGSVCEKEGVDIAKANSYFDSMRKKYPNGMMVRFYSGKLAQINGDIKGALKEFKPLPEDDISFKCACYWESFWCYVLTGNFIQANAIMDKLLKNSTWSPAVFTYLKAITLMSMTTEGAKAEGKALMSKVEGLRKKIAGKSIPDEKFAAKKAQQFLNGETNLALAIPEAAYIFNYLKVGNVNPKIAKFWREFLKQKQNEIVGNKDDLGLASLLNTTLYNMVDRCTDAEKEAKHILENMSDPMQKASAMFELGNARRLQGDPVEALQKFEAARTQFTGYYTESRLHFRTFAFEQLVKSQTKSAL